MPFGAISLIVKDVGDRLGHRLRRILSAPTASAERARRGCRPEVQFCHQVRREGYGCNTQKRTES
jgi:hypothetical protein